MSTVSPTQRRILEALAGGRFINWMKLGLRQYMYIGSLLSRSIRVNRVTFNILLDAGYIAPKHEYSEHAQDKVYIITEAGKQAIGVTV